MALVRSTNTPNNMNRSIAFFLTLTLLPSVGVAQDDPKDTVDSADVHFTTTHFNVQRLREGDKVVQLAIEADDLQKDKAYVVRVEVNAALSTLSRSEFTLDVPFTTLQGKDGDQSRNFYLILKGDSLPDRERSIVLDVVVTDKATDKEVPNKADTTRMNIVVNQAAPQLADYNYLAYIGTNFDLVDGIQAKNLFFATNIFVPRSTDSRKGLFISLYGNRAFTSTDSSSNVPWRTALERTSDTTYRALFAKADRVTTLSADNLGAYFSPFFGLGRLSDKDNGVQYHFAPAAEFVWRRIARSTSYSNPLPSDTTNYTGTLTTSFTSPASYTARENRFEFKIGPGIFISHDTKKISLHAYFNAGYNALFIPQGLPAGLLGEYEYATKHDFFVSARAWITEPYTGLTVQAEVTNTWNDKRPFYVVTLSKALSFSNLGTLFQPITKR